MSSHLLVLLDERFDAIAIYEADRDAVIAALTAPGSRSRSERGALGLGKFKSIGRLVWQRVQDLPPAKASSLQAR